jgi:hypothetical protein
MSESAKKNPAAGETDESGGTATAGTTAESLEQVRNILFGAQQRDSDKRIAKLEDRVSHGLDELRGELLEQAKNLREEARISRLEMQEVMLRVLEELRSEKADRSLLAQLFSGMAAQLGGEDDKPRRK